MRKINVRGLRHTFAVRALESGMSVKTLSKFLGHAYTAFTMDIYCHAADELLQKEMALLQDFF